MAERILRRPEVEQQTGLSCSTIYERMAKGKFPKPVKLGPQSVGWLSSEVTAYVQALVDQRDHGRAA